MNIQEFVALTVGDKVSNTVSGSTSIGEVTSVTPSGVRVVWGKRHATETPFFYSVQTTAWMHWTKTEPLLGGVTSTS